MEILFTEGLLYTYVHRPFSVPTNDCSYRGFFEERIAEKMRSVSISLLTPPPLRPCTIMSTPLPPPLHDRLDVPCTYARTFLQRDRRFRELSEEDRDRLRVASEAEAAAKAQAKEEAAKKAKKGNKKGAAAKGKKAAKGAAAAPPPPAEDGPAETEVEPPSTLEVYDRAKREVEQHRAMRKEEIERLRAEERLVPRDPAGEVVMEEVSSLSERLCSFFWGDGSTHIMHGHTQRFFMTFHTTGECGIYMKAAAHRGVWVGIICRDLYGYPSVHGTVFSKSKILRSGSVRF